MEAVHLENKNLASILDHYRSTLFPYAYNILGDLMEAEDTVQETLNKYFLSSHEHVENQDGYLVRSVINRAINQKQLLRNRMEQYPGHWLPTPVFTEEGIYARADSRHILNYSLLVLLERLNPKERAVFILKETFDFSHPEIGDMLGITEESSRQLLKRGKEKVGSGARETVSADKSKILLGQLTDAILGADIEKVKSLLAADIRTISDGGSKVSAARNIISGKEGASKLLKAIYSKYMLPGATTTFTTMNHRPAILYLHEGRIFRIIVFEMDENYIEKIFIMVNPDKLQALQPDK